MKILPQQTLLFTEDTLTLSPEDSLASHSALQGKEKERKMSATSGRKCLELYGRFSRNGLWAKTFSGLLIGMEGWYSTRCRLTWKLKGTKSRRMYFQLVPSTLHIEGTGSGSLGIIKMTDGTKIIVDSEDYNYLNQWKWKNLRGYAARTVRVDGKHKNLLMHRELTNAQKGEEVDHINRNKLDNRKENLRIVGHYINSHNREKGSGVHKPKGRNKWYAQIYVNNVRTHIGCFDTREEAIVARMNAEIKNGLLPTPISGDWKGQLRSDGTANMLSGKASLGLLPTPATRDYRGPNGENHMEKPGGKRHMTQLPNALKFNHGMSGQLNPRFVGELMGFPPSWLEI